MKTLNIAAIFWVCIFTTSTFAQNYQKVKVYLNQDFNVKDLIQLGISAEGNIDKTDNSISIFLDDAEFALLKQNTDDYKILIEDWYEYYNNRSIPENSQMNLSLRSTSRKYNVTSFTYGSMGGFYTLEEVYEILDLMNTRFPDIISVKESIGKSYENREIYVVKISDNVSADENKSEVLYTALHHAREPESMMQMIYFMWYLLENYNTDDEVTFFVNNRELFFIPVVNPDGYYYNQANYPNGGGMWRKNRRDNGDGYFGVDLNRNYGPYEYWNAANGGSSTNTFSNTYRGTDPFSEPETEVIKDFLISRDFKSCLNYHSYGNLLIFPYGALERETPDSLTFRKYAREMTVENNYEYGTDGQTVGYSTRGNSDDYMYDGDVEIIDNIFTMTPEIGSNADGFWPAWNRIIPIAEENMLANLYIANVAGSAIEINELTTDKTLFSAGDSIDIKFNVYNYGLTEASGLSARLECQSPWITLEKDSIIIPNISATSILNDQKLLLKIDENFAGTDSIKLLLSVNGKDILPVSDSIIIYVNELNTSCQNCNISYNCGWNIVSMPLNSNNAESIILDESIGKVYRYNEGYEISNGLQYGEGYWIKYTSNTDKTISGEAKDTIKINKGWNLIGSFSKTISVNEINNVYSFWEFANSYKLADSIKCGKGYWVKADAEDCLIMNKENDNSYFFNFKDIVAQEPDLKIDITADDGVSDQVILSIGLDPIATDGLNSELGEKELPPPPPSGIFFPRFTLPDSYISSYSDYRYCEEPYNGEYYYNFSFQLGNDSEELKLDWILPTGISMNISDKFGGILIKENFSEGNCEFVLSNKNITSLLLTVIYDNVVGVKNDVSITSYKLSQNYPNPFNPTTTIEYSLKNYTHVELVVYNLVGEVVQRLVNAQQSSGKYSVNFDASQLTSGIYFYRLVTNEFVQTNKMLLLK